MTGVQTCALPIYLFLGFSLLSFSVFICGFEMQITCLIKCLYELSMSCLGSTFTLLCPKGSGSGSAIAHHKKRVESLDLILSLV